MSKSHLIFQGSKLLLCDFVVQTLRVIHDIVPVFIKVCHSLSCMAASRVPHGEYEPIAVGLSGGKLIYHHRVLPAHLRIFKPKDRNVEFSIIVDEVSCFQPGGFTQD